MKKISTVAVLQCSPRQPFSGKLMAASGTEYGSVGDSFNVSDRYLGLKVVIKGKIHHGWARLSVIVGGRHDYWRPDGFRV